VGYRAHLSEGDAISKPGSAFRAVGDRGGSDRWAVLSGRACNCHDDIQSDWRPCEFGRALDNAQHDGLAINAARPELVADKRAPGRGPPRTVSRVGLAISPFAGVRWAAATGLCSYHHVAAGHRSVARVWDAARHRQGCRPSPADDTRMPTGPSGGLPVWCWRSPGGWGRRPPRDGGS